MSRYGFSMAWLMFWFFFSAVVPVRADGVFASPARKSELLRVVPESFFRLDAQYHAPEGIAFRHPSDWTVEADVNGIGLIPPRSETNEQYRVIFLPAAAGLTDPAHPRFARELDWWVNLMFPGLERSGEPEPFTAGTGGEGAAHHWNAWNSNGFEVQLRKFVIIADGDALCLVAAGPRALVEKRLPVLAAVAETLTFSPAVARMTPLARDWTQMLRGHRLIQARARLESRRFEFDGPAEISLGADGTFSLSGISSSSGLTGRWRVFERAGAAFLELRAERGTLRFRLDAGHGFTWLDGDPFLSSPVSQ